MADRRSSLDGSETDELQAIWAPEGRLTVSYVTREELAKIAARLNRADPARRREVPPEGDPRYGGLVCWPSGTPYPDDGSETR